MKRTGIILLSGGLDSTTALWMVKKKYHRIYSLTFTYSTKDEEVMLKVAKRLSELAGTIHKTINLPWLKDFAKLRGSSLVAKKEIPLPFEKDLDDSKKAKKTAKSVWVPARNLVFVSIAASFADALGENTDIITGFDIEEAQTFPDNSQAFVDSLNKTLKFSVLEKKIRVVAPLIEMNKTEIAELALELDAPIEYTSSCYNPPGIDDKGRPIHCRRCESCVRRKKGFKRSKKDRTIYKH